MDFLQRLYRVQMTLREDPPLVATVRWYWAAPGAQVLGGEHAFGSMAWETDDHPQGFQGVGEVGLEGNFVKHEPPACNGGLATITPREWFSTGVPAGVSGPAALPACCASLAADGGTCAGGVILPAIELFALGGTAEDGAASIQKSYVVTADGGTAADGYLLPGEQKKYSPVGGTAEDGGAFFPGNIKLSAAGGTAADGGAEWPQAPTYTALGGTAADGGAFFPGKLKLLASGGTAEDGALTREDVLYLFAAGGTAEDGTASVLVGDSWITMGGMLKGGYATSTVPSYEVTTTGGKEMEPESILPKFHTAGTPGLFYKGVAARLTLYLPGVLLKGGATLTAITSPQPDLAAGVRVPIPERPRRRRSG